jgi:hypothetical protein
MPPQHRRLPVPEYTHDLLLHADVAWQRVCDTRGWPSWLPGIDAVRVSSQHLAAVTWGRVRVGGVWLPLRVRDFVHAESVAMQVAWLPGPRLTIQPTAAGCLLRVRGAPAWWARDAAAGLAAWWRPDAGP